MKTFRIRSNPKPSRPALGPRGRVRPALEILEDRTLLSFAGPVNLPVGLLRIGVPLHDIGKIGIDDAILRKREPLTIEEVEHMKSHTLKGAALIRTLPGLDIA